MPITERRPLQETNEEKTFNGKEVSRDEQRKAYHLGGEGSLTPHLPHPVCLPRGLSAPTFSGDPQIGTAPVTPPVSPSEAQDTHQLHPRANNPLRGSHSLLSGMGVLLHTREKRARPLREPQERCQLVLSSARGQIHCSPDLPRIPRNAKKNWKKKKETIMQALDLSPNLMNQSPERGPT